ncbi:MAG: 16S rRNA (uracil(1498)-N(3))-methyltransferase [Phycisphaeraceae bacterium]
MGEPTLANRFYCASLPDPRLSDGAARLDRNQAHHARRVLRLRVGDTVELFDGRGRIGRGVIESWTDGAVVQLSDVQQVEPLRPTIDLAAPIPKGPRADDMVNQLSQLGVDRFIPLQTQRSVVTPGRRKLDKFTRAAIESAKQSRRPFVMAVSPPTTLDQALRLGHDLTLMAAPNGDTITDLAATLRGANRVLILIGPEGGWTDEEVDAARRADCVTWSVAANVLRIETAAVAAAAVARYLTGWPTRD